MPPGNVCGRMPDDVSNGAHEAGIDYLAFLKRRWTPLDVLKLALLAAVGLVFYYFFFVRVIYQHLPIFDWAWGRFEARYNSEHGKLVPFIFAFLVWWHKDEVFKAKKEGDNRGLIWIVAGCIIFALGARTLQGRVGMMAGPILIYGVVLYLWGKEVARALMFPIAFLVFMIPVSGPVDQATAKLQFLVVGIAQHVCGLMGIHLYQVGTTLRPLDNSYQGFEIAEGCSGIRSLMAMVMVTAIYVHLTETELWRKSLILCCSIGFAIIGNAGRIVSIFVVAKFFGADFAGGSYHEVSGYVSFPIALMAMLGVSRGLDWATTLKKDLGTKDSPTRKIIEKKDDDDDKYDY